MIPARCTAILDSACEVFARRGYQAATMRDVARASHLSLAGVYHYVSSKDELLFLVLARALDTLLAGLDKTLIEAEGAQARLLALMRTHLEFGFAHPAALRVVNRDWELLDEPRRSEIVGKRRAYIAAGVTILRELDPHARAEHELYSATNLLLGMLNGIATPSFLRAPGDPAAVAGEVSMLFLHGFLGSQHRRVA
ncbi:MAG: TetR/AcrR family transcriptional regulator [Candidatus Rokuibacteriota bacterium]